MKLNNVFVDADPLLYSVGYATQRNVYHVWVQGHQGDPSFVCTDKRWLNKILKDEENYVIQKHLHVQPFFSASTTIDLIIDSYKKKFSTDNIHLFFTGDNNFRNDIATIKPYKGNRDSSHKPVHYQAIKDYCISKHSGINVHGQEADDEVSIRQAYENQGTSVIVSIDKDLDMVQGYHYNPNKDLLYRVTRTEGLRWFYEQLLQGDSTDNIPGIPKIGKVTAKKLLANLILVEDMENLVLEKYTEYYAEPEKALLEVGRLLWMRLDYNQMWYPIYMGGPKIETAK